MKVPASYYQQFDADYSLDIPGEGYGGWKKSDIKIAPEHTALVVMHAWDCGKQKDYPGWYRAVEYIPRAHKICKEVFPRLLSSVRQAGMPVFHVVGGGDYYKDFPGYKYALSLVGPEDPPEQIGKDPVREQLDTFRQENVFVGKHNQKDVNRGFANLDFPEPARPLDSEPVAATGGQLFAICKDKGINHLIFAGFTVNGCLLVSPGGMVDMSRHGILCSTIPQAVTAIENRESARTESNKQTALWRIGLCYGFVFDLDDFLSAIHTMKGPSK
jgi:nicotinamidase-related amidase